MQTFRRGNWRWGKTPKATKKQKKSEAYFAKGGVSKKKPVKRMLSTGVGKVTIRRRRDPET
jgi:hypothetical protein